MPQGIFICI